MTNEPPSTTPALDDAMQLFNAGNYAGVIALVSGASDPALLLAARSYAEIGQYDTAGYLLRDLIQIIPGSTDLHSYLADVMEKTGDEHAVSEYATALLLDPENRQPSEATPDSFSPETTSTAQSPPSDPSYGSAPTQATSANSCRP